MYLFIGNIKDNIISNLKTNDYGYICNMCTQVSTFPDDKTAIYIQNVDISCITIFVVKKRTALVVLPSLDM